MGLPALGIAGADLFKREQVELLQGLKLYVHKEPDQGGDTFTAKIYKCLRDGEFTGTVYRWDCAHLDAKDPSDVYLAHGKEDGGKMIRDALAAAELIDLEKELLPEVIPGAPAILRQPEAWIYSESGISSIDPKTMTPTCICRTPIILTQRLKSIETGEEKMEVAFKRDGQWTTAIYPRDAVFSSRGILDLSRLGCTVTSENARQVVKFLGALEAENIDLIPKADATSTFGWQPGKRFLPGRADNLVLDIDPSQRSMAAAYCQNGTFEGWLANMAPHRERDKFRFILAASFAAPLLRIVKQRIFFVYNWGGSKGGKTATMKAALSAWGDPERLMISFNTTIAGLERTAAFYCDLPLGIDERQQAGDKQGLIQQLVYMVSGGKGKIRAAKNGGLQTTYQWRTVALATGEEPLSTDTTMTGVSTRVLEIYGGPFDDETAASLMHQQAGEDCGWAGPAFVERLIGTDERQIVLPTDLLVSDDGTVTTNTAPTTPGSITVPESIQGGSTITVSWTASTDAQNNLEGYVVERSTNGGTSWSQIYQGSALSATNTVPAGTQTVMYRVKAYDSDGLSSGYKTSGQITVINNTAPSAPASITVPNTVYGGQSNIVTWGAATDPDGDAVTYTLERQVDGGDWSQIYTGSALSYTDTVTRGWTSVAYRVKAVDSRSASGPYATSPTRTVNNNLAPTVTCSQASGTNLGTKNTGFSIDYSVSDPDGDTVTVKEAIDGEVKRTFTATAGTTYTFQVTGETFMKVLNGDHTLTITANDTKMDTVHKLLFKKEITAAMITLTEPVEADAKIAVCVLSVNGSIPADANFEVKVTNNGKDTTPTWEDCTNAVKTGANHVFTNNTQTNGWAFNFKVTVSRGASGQGGYINSVQGGFQ